MPLQLTADSVRKIWPRAPQAVIDAFASPRGQAALDKAGITHTRPRLSVAFSQVEHETNGFTIKDLTENINYRAEGAAKIWPKRFPPVRNGVGDPATVRAKYGTAPGWQLKMFDDVYGNRMGNRPGTHDGSDFIGHGGPQWTGRDGHEALARHLKNLVPGLGELTAEQAIAYAIDHKMQPEVLATFWMWKNLNPVVDAGGLKAATKPWNGGYIGMADREARMQGNDPIVARMAIAERLLPVAKDMAGGPPTPAPPQDVIDATTEKERKARKGGVGIGAGGGGNEAVKTTQSGTEQPSKPDVLPLLPTPVAYGLIALGVVVVIVATILIARKRAAVIANWF